MATRVIEAREETFNVGENSVTVYSHESLAVAGQHLVRVMWAGGEVVALAMTRGEAMGDVAEFLQGIARELKKRAFEQEGYTGLTSGELAP